MKLYVGCSLTQAPPGFKEDVTHFKEMLRADFKVLEFLGLETGTPRDVYRHDIHDCVAGCDIFVALCDYPAIGLGYELAAALEKFEKPTIALAHRDAKVTRLVQGIDNHRYSFERYDTFAGAVEQVRRFVSAQTS